MKTLNFFESRTDPVWHENQLTRAFLIILKSCPAAHQVWLSLVDPKRSFFRLPQAEFFTQRQTLLDKDYSLEEAIEGVSVLLAADEQEPIGDVEITDRGQILDGIVQYGEQLLVVIETKLDGVVPTRQASQVNVHGKSVDFSQQVVQVSWRDLIGGWYDLLENNWVTASERILISDFISFVDHHFPRLGPYSTLAKCNQNNFRIQRRLSNILNEISNENEEKGWMTLPNGSLVDRACLNFEEGSVKLMMWPGDTLSQARRLYTNEALLSRLLSLREKRWEIKPNFHFGFMAKGLAWTTAETSLEKYVDYWRKNIGNTGQIARADWEGFWENLIHLGFARKEEKAVFDSAFTNTSRNNASPRPGLECSFSWPLSEAERLDDCGELQNNVHEQLKIFLQAIEGSLN